MHQQSWWNATPSRLIGARTSAIPTNFMQDAHPYTTLPIYPGLRQARNMLACHPTNSVKIWNDVPFWCWLNNLSWSCMQPITLSSSTAIFLRKGDLLPLCHSSLLYLGKAPSLDCAMQGGALRVRTMRDEVNPRVARRGIPCWRSKGVSVAYGPADATATHYLLLQ